MITETAGNYALMPGLVFARSVKTGMVWLFKSRVSLTTFSINRDGPMDHLQKFCPRNVLLLPIFTDGAWQLKGYAISAKDRVFAEIIATAARTEALKRLPEAGVLMDRTGNHAVGFQIVHFAEDAIVSPLFYWQWGSVPAKIPQSCTLGDPPRGGRRGNNSIIGCVWEMKLVSFEMNAWRAAPLNEGGTLSDRLALYLKQQCLG